MLYHQDAARDNVRNRNGQRVFYLGKGDQLTSAARDWLQRERIEILPADQAKSKGYHLANGATLPEKPEHMTHLNAEILVPKTHPRILFRGKMDTLEAELILTQLSDPALVTPVGEVLALARRILRADVLQEPLKEERLCGLDEQEQRRRSHFPQDYYGQPHFMPSAQDGTVIARLNRARCAAREAELAAAAAYTDGAGNLTRSDIPKALNRMSSMLYLLMIQRKAAQGSEKTHS